jgi:phytoene dehydrogenase-like protein
LAKAGLDVLVLERSARIGGACVTEELYPGFRFSTFAYGAHGPGQKICRDLEVPDDAFVIESQDPTTFHPFPDGDHIMIWKDRHRTADGLSRLGGRESEGFLAYQKFIDTAISIAEDWFLRPPISFAELYDHYKGGPKAEVLEAVITRSQWDILGDYFDSEKVKCAFARADDAGDPTAVGSLIGEVVECASRGAGVQNKSGVVHGGMGMITQALADAVRRFGGEIRTEAAVDRILIENGRSVGVRLESGKELRARLVVSNADPKRTFLTLVREEDLATEFRRKVMNLHTRAGYMKYHAAISDIPRYSALPDEFASDPKAVSIVRIAPTLEYFRQAWIDSQRGEPSQEPILSLQLPTAYTPEMAPEGKHVFGAWVRYGPGRLRNGHWDDRRAEVRDGIVRILDRYAPGFGDLIEWQKLYTPLDIERETGITDASIRHVDQTLDQMLHRRPLPRWSAYKTPLDGLWLCGSGTHPSGSVTGGPGHNAAHSILDSMTNRDPTE